MELISPKLKVDFIGKAKFAFLLSFLMLAYSGYVWFSQGDAKYGIDFKGGHEIIVKVMGGADTGSVRKALGGAGFESLVVQAFESNNAEFAVRLSGEQGDASEIRSRVVEALKGNFPDGVEMMGSDFVGPTIGLELQKKALTAVIIGLLGMLLYITYRFEFAFALGAVAALTHDVIVCMGIYLLAGHTLNMATLAAALTVVGYSVNDTIIVFDRMREEMYRQQKTFDLVELMNYSISATLSRTVITSLLTLFSALALLVYGGGAIADLSLFLVAGVIAGTYSTIFIASPVALAWENFRTPVEEKA
jgi:preprotein translocase subunit SecF